MPSDATIKARDPLSKTTQTFDHLDSSVHDLSLRSLLLTGYSLFKVCTDSVIGFPVVLLGTLA